METDLKPVRDYLGSVRRMDADILILEKEYRRLESRQTYIRSPALGDDKVTGAGRGGFTGLSERLADKAAEITKLKARRDKIDKRIRKQIGQIHGRYGQILLMRYMDRLSLMDIADRIGYSYDQTSRDHIIALQIFRARFF